MKEIKIIANEVFITGHFGEFLQGKIESDGPIVLVTVPNAKSMVTIKYSPGPFNIVQIGSKTYTKTVVARILSALKLPIQGQFRITMAMPEACGLGSSTALRVGLLLSTNSKLPADFLARSCVANEGASDPIMYDSPEKLLWAPRSGKIIKTLPKLPALTCVGGLYGEPQRTDPTDSNFPIISDLIKEWEVPDKTLSTLGEICSESSARTLKLKGLSDDPTKTLAKQFGAVGFSIAHTGCVRNLIFPYKSVPPDIKKHLQKAGFKYIQKFSLGRG